MEESPSAAELPQSNNDDMLELNKDLERMIEDVENMSVQLTWMAYDLVTLRTSPEVEASMQKLEEAHIRCRTAVCGEPELDQEPNNDPDQEPDNDPDQEPELESSCPTETVDPAQN